MFRKAVSVLVYVSLVTALPTLCTSQTSAELHTYFKESIKLSRAQITDIQSGKAVGKVLESRAPSEIFVFGAVYIKAAPERYIQLASDFDRLRKLPEFLAIGKFSNPPKLTDLGASGLTKMRSRP